MDKPISNLTKSCGSKEKQSMADFSGDNAAGSSNNREQDPTPVSLITKSKKKIDIEGNKSIISAKNLRIPVNINEKGIIYLRFEKFNKIVIFDFVSANRTRLFY